MSVGCRVKQINFDDPTAVFDSLLAAFDGQEQDITQVEMGYSPFQPFDVESPVGSPYSLNEQFVIQIPIDLPFSSDYPQCGS